MLGGAADTADPSSLIEAARFAAYAASFRLLAVTTALLVPGVLLFRILPPDPDPDGPACAASQS
jgi:hypothetical protein